MAGNKKVTVKSLSEELANVKEELKEMQFLKQKVEELETEIRALKVVKVLKNIKRFNAENAERPSLQPGT